MKTDLKAMTVYLEQDDDTFLETITHTGRTSQLKDRHLPQRRRPASPSKDSMTR